MAFNSYIKKSLVSIFAFTFAISGVFAQNHIITGSIKDKKTKEAVAFANIFIENTQYGTISDISGNFSLKISSETEKIRIKCMGYRDTTISVNANTKKLNINLIPIIKQLNDVVIRPGINPANRIIQAAINNKKNNDFQKKSSYSYKAYNRGVIEFAHDNEAKKNLTNNLFAKKNDTVVDSFEMMAEMIMDSTFFFLTENISECKHKAPDKNKETIIASRTSGTTNPLFSIILNQMQSTSFYSNNIEILATRYLNPIRKGTFKRYYFEIKDTTFDGQDTIFGITFNPIPNKNFNSLKGKIFINTNGYAIQNIVAEPVLSSDLLNSIDLSVLSENPNDTTKNTKPQQKGVAIGVSTTPDTNAKPIANNIIFKVQHQYLKDSLNRWYPDLFYFELGFRMSKKNDLVFRFVTTNTISHFTFDTKFRRREFSDVVLEFEDDATEQDSSLWLQYRSPMTQKEKNTHILYDSIIKKDSSFSKLNIDKAIDWIMVFSTGKIPFGKFAIDINKLYQYNGYEHSRYGLGLDFSPFKWTCLSGYFGYGYDKLWKYGGNLDFYFDKYHNYALSLFYKNDLTPAANTIIKNYNLLDINSNIEYTMNRFSKVQQAGAKINLPLFYYTKASIQTTYSQEQLLFDANTILYKKNKNILSPTNSFAEINIGLTYEYKRYKVRLPKYELSLNGEDCEYPAFKLEYTRGISIFDANTTFNRVLFQYTQNITFQHYGTFHFYGLAGYVDKTAPYTRMFNIAGTKHLHYYFRNAFLTLQNNDFTSTAFANACISFDFAQTFWNTKFSKPHLFLQLNSLIGTTNGQNISSDGIPIKAPQKGILEPCIAVKDIITYSTIKLGLGYAYRISPYNSPHEWNNMAALFTIDLNF